MGGSICSDMQCNVVTRNVFIRIVAMATTNFSLAGVRLLIKVGSYSRVAFINFGAIPLGTVHKNGHKYVSIAYQHEAKLRLKKKKKFILS